MTHNGFLTYKTHVIVQLVIAILRAINGGYAFFSGSLLLLNGNKKEQENSAKGVSLIFYGVVWLGCTYFIYSCYKKVNMS